MAQSLIITLSPAEPACLPACLPGGMSACLPACLPACLSVLRLIAALACGVAWACVHTGVSNYGEHHLDELLANASISPSINQVEISPFNQRYAILERNAPLTFPPAYCK
jgi:hypothetical protein